MIPVRAQGTPTIDILTTVGGTATANPTAPYTDGQTVTLTASPGNGFIFQNWVLVSAEGATTDTNNPTTLTVTDGNAYAVQANFAPVENPPGQNFNVTNPTNAVVVVVASIGGTTTPVPGRARRSGDRQGRRGDTADSPARRQWRPPSCQSAG